MALAAPKFVQTPRASAACAVILISDGVLDIIILMGLFGRIKCRGGDDLGDDWLLESARLLNRGLGRFRQPLLCFTPVIDTCPILRALVAELRVCRKGIVVPPEDLGKL